MKTNEEYWHDFVRDLSVEDFFMLFNVINVWNTRLIALYKNFKLDECEKMKPRCPDCYLKGVK